MKRTRTSSGDTGRRTSKRLAELPKATSSAPESAIDEESPQERPQRATISASTLPTATLNKEIMGKPSLTLARNQVAYLRMKSNLLIDSTLPMTATSGAIISKHLFGVQAQEPTPAFVSILNRTVRTQLPIAGSFQIQELQDSIARAATTCPEMVRIWGQRSTIHVYASEDWHLVKAAFMKPVSASRTSSIKSGNVTGKNDLKAFETVYEEAKAVLRENGNPLTRQMLEDLRHDGRFAYSVFMCASIEGVGCRIDVKEGSRVQMVARSPAIHWPESVEEPEAILEVAGRYFHANGPANEQDFRYHYNLTARDSKPAVSELVRTGEIVPVTIKDAVEASTKSKVDTTSYVSRQLWDSTLVHTGVVDEPDIPTRLLYRFDPLLLAHKDKGFWLPPELKHKVWTKNGIILPTVLHQGRVIGTWKLVNRTVRVEMFDEHQDMQLKDEFLKDLRSEANRLGMFLYDNAMDVLFE
ncbi:winged helix DNA-binding domain-containing protein [Phlyctochytrium arcticum]|nr:winged helix DNA-binding domain-containing protein [Phlyctochytrium arcticum]